MNPFGNGGGRRRKENKKKKKKSIFLKQKKKSPKRRSSMYGGCQRTKVEGVPRTEDGKRWTPWSLRGSSSSTMAPLFDNTRYN